MAAEVRLIRSPLSVAGMVLTTVSAVLFVVVFVADLVGLRTNPYFGIVFFLLLPVLFLVGLVLIPLGAWIERRRRAAGRPPSAANWPRVDLNDPRQRTTAIAIFALTMANVIIVSLAAYRGVEYMDSPAFCGQVCHAAMEPEFVSHEAGPHANVKCVACHVGEGASSFTKAKLAGTERVFAIALRTHSRPIVARAETLLSATSACEQCHWPKQPHGDTIRRVFEYADDEQNTESVTTLRVHVGGGDGGAMGIHGHMNVASEIEYIATDAARQTIPYVRMTDPGGVVREYVVEGTRREDLASGVRRRMDCMDCHNRPSHVVAATPERAVNDAMARGGIPKTLPFIHREAVKVLKVAYPSRDAAAAGISRELQDFYARALPQGVERSPQAVGQAVRAVQEIYRQNVFPGMGVSFGTYPNNIGHVDFPGCFRCHDDNHTSSDGRRIGQDCESCHSID